MQIPENILVLIKKYETGTATPDELQELNEWYHSFNDSIAAIPAAEQDSEAALAEKIKLRLLQTIRETDTVNKKPLQRRWKWAAAAAILILIAAGTYWRFSATPVPHEIAVAQPVTPPLKNDIAPGGNKAILTLVDGSTVVLDSATNGTISQQGNVAVKKLDNGLLAYTINGKQLTENDEAFYNTITTPRGGQYQVTLSDGTKVWLNAASSIRFPVVFGGAERTVTITGEAYFEVTKNAAMPFKVKTNTSEVEVLGTHFNVNAYDDETAVKTTLLEGAVKIAATGNATVKYLQPGQQSVINKEGRINIVDHADTEEAMAWLNGHFQFKSSDLRSILRQISRWYDVDIVYSGNVNLHFTGQLTRNENASKVFEALALTNEVHFKIDGKKIIVSP